MTEPTVLDVLRNDGTGRTTNEACTVLGIDPDMPYEQFTRWLRYGQRADELEHHWTHEGDRVCEWNRCLDAIKGDQP